MADVTKEDRFILCNITGNNNKWWDISLSDDSVVCRWRRVGETGDQLTKKFSNTSAAERFYESKCREKQKKGYQPLKTISSSGTGTQVSAAKETLAEIATKQIQTSSPETIELVKYLTQANIHSILSSTTIQYDISKGVFSTPLGIVTKDAITEARDLLSKIGTYVAANDLDSNDLIPHLNQYLMLIPQDIGRSRPSARTLYPNLDAVQRQSDILDSLDASVESALHTPVEDTERCEEPKIFEVKLHTIENGLIIDRVRKKYRDTQQSIHGSSILDVKRVYSVEIDHMRKAYHQHLYCYTIDNEISMAEDDEDTGRHIWELWHGSKKGNLLSIMAKGFVIPSKNASHCTGRMFGNGVYFSDQSTKSLNYAWGYWDSQRDDNCFMFIADVLMGNYYTPRSSSETLPKPGYDSTFAKASQSGVLNNEMIVYNTAQINPTYLVEFSKGGK